MPVTASPLFGHQFDDDSDPLSLLTISPEGLIRCCRLLSLCSTILTHPLLLPHISPFHDLTHLLSPSTPSLVRALVKMPRYWSLTCPIISGIFLANTLSDYLGSPSCPIIKLVMQSADVDDFECTFVLAIQTTGTAARIRFDSKFIRSS